MLCDTLTLTFFISVAFAVTLQGTLVIVYPPEEVTCLTRGETTGTNIRL